jgi:hypothetical protein
MRPKAPFPESTLSPRSLDFALEKCEHFNLHKVDNTQT